MEIENQYFHYANMELGVIDKKKLVSTKEKVSMMFEIPLNLIIKIHRISSKMWYYSNTLRSICSDWKMSVFVYLIDFHINDK